MQVDVIKSNLEIVKATENDLITNRAWLEINLDNLEYNLHEIKKKIHQNTKIMAVVKANAYGHGAIEISKKLNSLGILDFAVATLSEGIELRKNGILGNILILGYTKIENLNYVEEYDLIQTIIDEEYAISLLQKLGKQKLKVHIKVNTGMNRLGVNSKNISLIKKLYEDSRIKILGIFTHLCVADSSQEEDVQFTKKQIMELETLIKSLEAQNIYVGKTHIQSSYGILNYPELECDYVRPGIILYGIHSEKNIKTRLPIDLKPVLTLKARVTSVRYLEPNSYISYGRTYRSKDKMKVATIAIGYADGYPRNLSGKDAKVCIHDTYVAIVGRICMDQLIVDVTELEDVKQGDIAILIGEDKRISMEEIAQKSSTITNEIASRMGERLKRITFDSLKSQSKEKRYDRNESY